VASVRLVLISDTHCYEPEITEEGDVLIHAGDFLLSGNKREADLAGAWLGRQAKKFENVVCIAGNHDWAFYHMGEKLTQNFFYSFGTNIHYLQDSSINIDGKNFYGSPVQPEFCNWAFNVPRGAAIRKYWDMIPDAGLVDCLLTHGPPMGILDQSLPGKSENLGCEDLAKKVEISKPLLHVFGHIHGSYGKRTYRGIQFFNASVVNEAYKVVNKPWVVEI